MKLKIKAILSLALLFAAAAVHGQTTDRAAEYMRRMTAAMESMPAYTVCFTASAGDGESLGGRYEVDGSRYHISVSGMEVYGDDNVRRNVDAAHREIVVDVTDTASHDLMENPVHGFRFLASDYRPQLRSEADGRAEIVLTPIAKRGVSETITVTITISDARPQQICYDAEGERVTIIIESIAEGASVPLFDASAYPDYEIIDFR